MPTDDAATPRVTAAPADAAALAPTTPTRADGAGGGLLRRAGLDADSQERLLKVRKLAKVLDSQFTVPGTSRSFGVDAVLGLIPGIGGAAGLVFSVGLIIQAIYAGARPVTVVRMLGIAGVDAAAGTVPVLGTVADFVIKANERNARILATQALQPERATADSSRIVMATVIIAVILVAALVLGAVLAVVLLLRAIF